MIIKMDYFNDDNIVDLFNSLCLTTILSIERVSLIQGVLWLANRSTPFLSVFEGVLGVLCFVVWYYVIISQGMRKDGG